MYLKSLTLCGFKSFAQRTTFEFDRGLTAIVGPNGCGKSNVVDGLKWVLGEQSAKSLRGGEMLDVIFNGSSTRKPTGFAEVTLTFAEVGKALGVDYEEVAITRRLFRTGESEYMINKTPCRLRDIRELFMDTGVGVISYSIIEQGKIAALLTANTQQRRQLFEEAAGISRYKWKAKEATRRLERVDLNLNRLNDLVVEVERQLSSAQRQAQKARRWVDLSAKLKEAKIALGLHTYHAMHHVSASVSGEIVALSDERAGYSTELGEQETAISSAEALLLDLQTRLQAAQQELNALNLAVREAEMSRDHNTELIEGNREQAQHADGRAEAAREAVVEIRRDLDAAQSKLSEARAVEVAAGAAVDGAQREAATQRAARDAAQQSMRDNGAELDRVEHEAAAAHTSLTEANAAARQLSAQQAGLAARRDELSNRRGGLDAEYTQAKQQVDEVRSTVEGWKQRHRTAQAEAQAAVQSVNEWSAKLENVRRDATKAQSRREALQSLRERMEGIPAGARGLVQGGIAGLTGLLADQFDIDAADAPAIEAVLGQLASGLVCTTREEAWTLMELLAERGEGRGVVLPTDGAAAEDDGALPEDPGVVGWARDHVRCAPELGNLRDRLLAGVLLVETRDVARRLAGSGLAGPIVTRQGEVVGGDAMVGGPQGAGPLAARAELARLELDIAELQHAVDAAETARAEATARREQAEASENELRGRILDGTYQLQEYEGVLVRVTEQRHAANQELEVIGKELAQCETRLAEASHNADAAQDNIADCAQRGAAARGAMDGARSTLGAAATALEAANQSIMERKVAEATARSEREAAETSVPQLTQRLQEKEHEAAQQGVQAQQSRTRIEKAQAAIHSAEQTLAESLKVRVTKQEAAAALQDDRREAEGTAKVARTAARRCQEGMHNVDRKLGDLRVAEAEKKKELEYLMAGIHEEYAVDLAELHREYDASQAPDPEALEIEVAELEGKIKRIGGVNHEAISELTDLEERHAFLAAQQEDLTAARQSLADIIRRINRKARDMFLETFEVVRKNFQVLFRKLFGGGKADIVLEDETDPLESGIEIIARPPGKEPRSISLLSGGEKSMTCAGVVFAIFRSRPSPFCFLDEVDAALDEANIDRFITTLKEFTKESQFLIITHRKPTMAAAQAIYGVTMPEPGVSRPVSMKLADAVAHLEPSAAK